MGYLLDTCVLSEFRKLKPDTQVMAWLGAQIEEALFLSALTIGEIQKGISLLPASKRRKELETWLETIRHLSKIKLAVILEETHHRDTETQSFFA